MTVCINCIYFNPTKIDTCSNRGIKRSFFGLGARMCCEAERESKVCEHKVEHKRPTAPPPPPSPPVAPEYRIIENGRPTKNK